MLLATTTVDDFDRFERAYSTKGAAKRKLHGSKGILDLPSPQRDRSSVGGLRLGSGRLEEVHVRS
jgi:hypothetical protein